MPTVTLTRRIRIAIAGLLDRLVSKFEWLAVVQHFGALSHIQRYGKASYRREIGITLDKFDGRTVNQAMEQTDRAAGVADGLLEPNDRLVRAGASVGFFVSVFGLATSIPSWCKWNNDQQSQGRSRDMCELFGFIKGIDVVELELGR